ncbi:MAG: hypothetical protein HZC47_02970 [Methanobacterium sp.]|uniref:hypothetical protein n=1 Tax=Methanobacterium sp. TaxID=2164 RepID=UPI003D65CF20|nr:hypothetical protein [Methanobacterium sp.]
MFLKEKPAQEVAEKVLKDFNDVEGLKEVVDGILSLTDSWVYEKLVHGVVMDPRVNSGDYDEPSKLIRFAADNMSKFPLNMPFAPLITAKDVLVIHTPIYDLFSINIGRDFTPEDLNKIFYGEMAARILFMLEEFDSNQETPQPTKKFFKRLGKIKWNDKKTKKLFNDLFEIRYMSVFNKWKGADGQTPIFTNTENAFLKLLSGCSAVVESRNKINTFDIFRAHKTYLKLIRTDISKLM